MTDYNDINPKCKNCIYLKSLLQQTSEVEDKLKCAIKITNLGVWDWNLATNQVQLSDEIFRITGHKKDDFDGTFDYVHNHIIHLQSQELLEIAITESMETGIVPQKEYKINNPSKKQCWVRINGELIYDDAGNKVKMIGTILDVTKDYMEKSVLITDLNFFESLMEALPNPIFYKDSLGLYRFFNNAFLDYVGLPREEIIGKGVYDVAPKDMADIYHKADLDLMEQQGHQVYESRVKYADGTMHDVIFSKAAHINEDGSSMGLVGIIQDITEKKASERRDKTVENIRNLFWQMNQSIMDYENEETFFNQILIGLQSILPHSTQSAVLKFDNPSTMSILASNGYVKEEAKDFTIEFTDSFLWRDTKGDTSRPHVINNIFNFINKGCKKIVSTISNKEVLSSLIIPIHINDELKWIISLDSEKNNIFDGIDTIAANFIQSEIPIFYRIFDLTRTTLKLSRYDALTELINRGYFETIFKDRIALAERSDESISLIIFDLDGLKKINDNYGHHSGDMYIKLFADTLKSSFRDSDSFARLGGDEFAGLFSLTNVDTIKTKIEELRKSFESIEFKSDGITFKGSFSYGIACYPNDTKVKSELMILADKRMYEDKIRTRK